MTAHRNIIIRVNGSIPESDRTLILPELVYLALEECAAKERRKVKGTDELSNIKRATITPLSLAQRVVRQYAEGKVV